MDQPMPLLPDSFVAASRRHPRLAAALGHLALSAVVGAGIGLAVIALLYPGDYLQMAGGATLFWMVVAVDVAIGPFLTFVAFDVRKRRRQLTMDLLVIAALQVGALVYGVHTLYAARPVALVFEVDRFRLLSPSMIAEQELPQALPAYRELPRAEVWVLGSRRAADVGQERLEAIQMAFEGYDLGQRPRYWQPYADSRADALKAALPAERLLRAQPAASDALAALARRENFAVENARFLPVVARKGTWVAILRPDGDIAGFLPFDGF
jgi:hypothetical protein